MHALLTCNPRKDLTHSKHVCKYLLWVLQFSYMPYYMGLGVSWVYMSQYWHLGHFSNFLCASRVEVSKMVFLCFEPEPFLIKGLHLWVASMQQPKFHPSWKPEIQGLE